MSIRNVGRSRARVVTREGPTAPTVLGRVWSLVRGPQHQLTKLLPVNVYTQRGADRFWLRVVSQAGPNVLGQEWSLVRGRHHQLFSGESGR